LHIGAIKDDKESIKLMQARPREGMNFWDNAWDYHDGRSETLDGQSPQGRRDKVFLMTKNCERDTRARSRISRLATPHEDDHLDLWQFP